MCFPLETFRCKSHLFVIEILQSILNGYSFEYIGISGWALTPRSVCRRIRLHLTFLPRRVQKNTRM